MSDGYQQMRLFEMPLAEEFIAEGLTITYEDGTVVHFGDCPTTLLHGSAWVGMLIDHHDPLKGTRDAPIPTRGPEAEQARDVHGGSEGVCGTLDLFSG